MMISTGSISWLDYAICLFSLLLSLCTGIYHAIASSRIQSKGSKHSQQDEYMMGGRQMPLIPVSLSLLTTFLSGILMLGVPAEMFQRGAQIWLNFITGAIASVITAVVFLPIFYRMRATCLHEYFIHRFQSKCIRKLFSLFFIILTLIYMSIVIYAPSVALSSVFEIRTAYLILIIGLTTTLYTVMGGLKAVVWTDSLQAILMYSGIFGLIIKSLNNPKIGGIGHVFSLAIDSGRLTDLARIDPNPAQYNTLLVNVLGGTITWLAAFGVNQMAIQRYCSLPSIGAAKTIIYATIVPFIILCTIVAFIGLLALAYFYNCNPLEIGLINNEDQLIILFAKEILVPTPGLFGLYVTCIMSATLSTLSSGMNSMAAAFYEDFLKEHFDGRISDRRATSINKVSSLIFGTLSTVLAFACEPLGGIIRVCVSIWGAMAGPFVGLFVLAIFVPRATRKPALIAFIASNILISLLCIWNYHVDPFQTNFLPTNTSIDGCSDRIIGASSNITIQSIRPNYDVHYGDPSAPYLARISIYAYPLIGLVLLLIIGYPLSFVFHDDRISQQSIMHLTFYGRNLPTPSTSINSVTKLMLPEKNIDQLDQMAKMIVISDDYDSSLEKL